MRSKSNDDDDVKPTNQSPLPNPASKSGAAKDQTLLAKTKQQSPKGQPQRSSSSNPNKRSYTTNSSPSPAGSGRMGILSKQELVDAVGKQMKEKRNQVAPPVSFISPAAAAAAATVADASTENSDGATTTTIQGGSISSSSTDESSEKSKTFSLDSINPFKAGQHLRRTIGTAISSIQTTAAGPDALRQSIYFLDDRFLDDRSRNSLAAPSSSKSTVSSSSALQNQVNFLMDNRNDDNNNNFVPEVLVVGATGALGRLVVRQLQASGRFRVRVLVRDLYTSTLNVLGTGVTYCQGDLNNPDSLEYACTDVDKLVFCESTPRPDEDQFRVKFQEFVADNMGSRVVEEGSKTELGSGTSNVEWEQLESVLALRSALAEQVDVIGMQNLIRAYQHVRHSDYGTSQAAKRALFKFQDRPEDFNLFEIDQGDNEVYIGGLDDEVTSESSTSETVTRGTGSASAATQADYFDEDDMEDQKTDGKYDYEDSYEDTYGTYNDYEYNKEDESIDIEQRNDSSTVKAQSRWIRNPFEHGVFVGRIPQETKASGDSEAAIISSRLRSRDDPENGIELGPTFAGFVCRLCSDGGTYEAFVRTGSYYSHAIEYVCEFSTRTKIPSSTTSGGNNKSRNKFKTLRLPFENFKPVQRKAIPQMVSQEENPSIVAFRGRDVRNIGFRFRTSRNEGQSVTTDKKDVEWARFYLALSYIKVYRSQPEPEFIYLSDARIPPIVRDGTVRHDAKQLVSSSVVAGSDSSMSSGGDEIRLLDDSKLLEASMTGTRIGGRSPEETYYKYRGEEILKSSGLSYAIVRVADFNESPGLDEKFIDLSSTGSDSLEPVSRADVAKVCVCALLDPHALNKSFYVSKSGLEKTNSQGEELSSKFASLPMDQVA